MSVWGRPLAATARVPFTILLSAAVLVIALVNGSATRELVPFAAQAWGFDPLHLSAERWPTLVTGAFLVRNFPMLVGVLILLAAAVGRYEARLGTLRAVALFWLSHLATLFLTAAVVVYPLHLASVPVQSDWAPAGDVGASFGGFGCLGGWVRRLDWPSRRAWIGIVTLLLAAKLLVYPERFGDVGHIIAFYAGMLLDGIFSRA